ncbi:MAG: phage baseplate assembly protein V [Saprospiraceae bacterium]
MTMIPSISALTGSAVASRTTDHVTVKVFIEGSDITSNPGGLMSLSVYKEFNKIPTARLLFEDDVSQNREFQKSNADLFVPGKQIDIQVGYDNEEESIFQGIIVRHSVKVLSGKPAHLEIECKDPAVKTTLVRKSDYFYNSKDSDVIKQIIRTHSGLRVGNVTDSPHTREELVQYHCTDWDFMVMRADANGMCVSVSGGEVHVKKPEVAAAAKFAVHLGAAGSGIPLIEMEADIDARTHYPSVNAKAWDFSKQEVVEAVKQGSAGGAAGGGLGGGLGGVASAASSVASDIGDAIGAVTEEGDGRRQFPEALFGQDPLLLYHGGDLESRELEAWAEAKMKRGDLSSVRGRVRILGIEVAPGDTIALESIGDRFDGNHLVSGVMHQVYGGTWHTDIQFGLTDKFFSDNNDASADAASGLLPGISGLHIGIVSKLDGDTQAGHHRIQVRIPYLAGGSGTGSQSEGIWARLSTLYAGKDRGFVFRPEVGDEVVLGFVNNDPNQAVVMGSLHNNKSPAPIPATRDNHQKVFVAKEGMELIFDDQKKSITLKTKNGNALVLSDQDKKISINDENGNSIEMSSSGISIQSASKVTIKGTPINLN